MNIPGLGKSKLERTESELNNPKAAPASIPIHDPHSERAQALPTSWGDDSPMLTRAATPVERKVSLGAKLFFLSLIVLLVAGGYTAWRFFSSQNTVSSEAIDMVTDMKPYVEGGEQVPMTVTINNRNTVALQDATLTLSYEKGVGVSDEQQKVSEKRMLGTVPPNQMQKQSFVVVLYGEEASSRDIIIKLEYKVPGSSALFSKILTTTSVLKTPPVSVHMDGPDTLSPGQLGTYTITVKNNTSTSSVPFRISLLLPDSFKVDSINPQGTTKNTIWDVQALGPGETVSITLRGSFSGNATQESTVRAIVGSAKGATEIAVVYSSDKKDVTLRTAPLGLSIRAETDRGSGDVLRFGDRATVFITYTNQGTSSIRNVEIKASIQGEGAMYDQINSDGGYYDSQSKTMLWNKSTLPELGNVAPGTSKELRMYIPVVTKGSNNPNISITADGTADDQGVGDVIASVGKSFAIQGSASLNGWTSYRESPFVNQGPVPPVANTATTYTIHLAVSAQNTLSSTKVSFILPIYVTWGNQVTSGENVTYNGSSRTVVWDIGQMSPGQAKSVDIQVSVKPSQSHVGTAPTITSGITLDGQETESRARIRNTISPLTTELPEEKWGGDPGLVVGQ